MGVWGVRDRTLARFHITPGFISRVIREMRPWLERITNIRRSVYLNATDPARKDQKEWMYFYETMLTESLGECARFLPRDPTKEKPNVDQRPATSARIAIVE